MPGIPERSDDCIPDPVFASSELLYRRYSADHIGKTGLRAQDFGALPGTSGNRSKYSIPEHAIHACCAEGKDRSTWGVYSLLVSDITAKTYDVANEDRHFQFYMKHKPLPDCKAHSEIHCRDVQSGADVAKAPSSVRSRFRIFLAQRYQVLLQPTG